MNTTMLHATPKTPNACLAKGAVASLSDHEGEILHCTSGHLWVTLEGEGVDHILMAGESLLVPDQGKLVVSGPGCFQLTGGMGTLPLAS
jgi:hypothetical protein